ncbi:MAG: radical SAM protein [Sedimentisphaerales bacterium]|jgi:radical SAM protein with 4Fe4S-binding SPASM domain
MINVSKLYCGLAGQSDHLRYGKRDSVDPIVVYNCTSRCNLRCLHCYAASDSARRDVELSTAQAKKLLADLVEANAPVVLFSGGEPLLRPDLFELLAEAKRIGLRTVISTNGTLIDGDTAQKIAEANVSYIGISIDGPEEFHNRFRQTSGCFKATMTGFENCRKANLRMGLRFTISNTNKEQVPAVFDICKDNGIRRVCFYHLIRSGRAKDIESQVVSPTDTRKVMDVILERTADFVSKGLLDEVLTVGNHADGPYLLVKMQEQGESIDQQKRLLLANGGNRIGQGIASVGWDGSVYADQFWRNYSLGNITQKTFKQIWTNPDEPVLQKLRNKSKFADKRCLKCKWFDLCKGNFRFLGPDPDIKNWRLEPDCYLTDAEIGL